jgi:hypothetical protein
MAKQKDPFNPFYLILVVVGIAFAITACAYCVMAFRAVAHQQATNTETSSAFLMDFLDQYGIWLMLAEIVLLAIATVGAIGTDDYWRKRAIKQKSESRGHKA